MFHPYEWCMMPSFLLGSIGLLHAGACHAKTVSPYYGPPRPLTAL